MLFIWAINYLYCLEIKRTSGYKVLSNTIFIIGIKIDNNIDNNIDNSVDNNIDNSADIR